MKGLIQRVKHASVEVKGQRVGAIDAGILLFLGVEKSDTEEQADKLLHKVLNYRIFADADGKMNESLLQQNKSLLLVSQFTLVADTQKGLRPGFSQGATPADGERLYNYFLTACKSKGIQIESGCFGANMQITLCNDGPVTFLLET